MTILVTGANGQLGCWLRLAASGSAAGPAAGSAAASLTAAKNQFSADGTTPSHAAADQFLFTDIAELSEESAAMLRRLGGEAVDLSTVRLDVTDLSAVRELVRRERVQAVVNCAGFTNVDAAESQPELAELLNVTAPENLALAMREAGGLLVHVSTDYIFGARVYDTSIGEEQPGAPTGVYGLTKLRGEEAIRRVGCRHVILRTAWLFSEFGRNFVRTMLRLTAERPQVKVVDDQRGTPTYAGDLAAVILQILTAAESAALSAPDASAPAADSANVFNFTNAGECTWYEFACAIAEAAGRTACEILPCRSDEFPSPVRRPAYSVLDKSKIRAALGLAIPAWRDSLRKCLKSIL
ncbi:MAG: dTDP-4-dehydrorhamnose reductase [Bacteroidales bacterium]|nr:dTDP-4-dehydrorhamnose reductase [Bacteroidales bacterium]